MTDSVSPNYDWGIARVRDRRPNSRVEQSDVVIRRAMDAYAPEYVSPMLVTCLPHLFAKDHNGILGSPEIMAQLPFGTIDV